MLGQLLVAGLLLAVCVIIHAVGTHATQIGLRRRDLGPLGPAQSHPLRMLVALFLLIFALHVVEIGVWAVFYVAAGVLPTFEEAVYFSIASYTTVGYGDVVLGPEWRVLGAAEAAAGVLLFGWSTALLFAAIQRLYQPR